MNKKIFLNLIGIAILIWVLMKIDLPEIFKILKNTNLFYYFLAVILLFPIFIIKALRWNYIKKIQGIHYSAKDSILMYFSGLYAGLITPGRFGEFVKMLYLTADNHSFGKSLLSVVFDRIFDLIFLAVFSYASIFIFHQYLNSNFFIYAIIVLTIITLGIILILNKKMISKVLNLFFKLFIPQKYKERASLGVEDFYNDLKLFKFKHHFILFFWTTISWLIYYYQFYALALALDINLSFWYLAASTTIVGLFTLIPISISGIGTRDVTLIFFFSLLGVSKELAVSFSLLILSMFLFMALFGIIAWFIKPIKLKKEEVKKEEVKKEEVKKEEVIRKE